MCPVVVELSPCRALPIHRGLSLFPDACHNFCVMKDMMSDPERLALDSVIVKLCDSKLIEWLLEECISSDRGKEIKSL